MNVLKLALPLLIILFLVSCATSQSSPLESDHLKGYNAAEEYAKKDAMKHICFKYPKLGYVNSKTKEYTKLLQNQGRSETFIKGFYFGYDNYYREFLDLYCGS
jgi:hypothetical protein